MKRDTKSQLKRFNQIYKEMDAVYHNYAKNCGLSDMAYWILYSMAEEGRPFTQRDFCKSWSFAPQSVNSALKDLENRGVISLEPVPGNKKNKWIRLTAEGEEFMAHTITPLIDKECETFEALSLEECELMLSVTQKYFCFLKDNVGKLSGLSEK